VPATFSADPPSAPLRFAVLGSGVIAEVFADALREVPGAELSLVIGRTAASARRLAETHEVPWTDDVAGWLRTPGAEGIDVLVVATPSGTHADLIVPALEAGKHALVEKPIDITLTAADRIREVERHTGNVGAVLSQHRFDSSTERLLDAIGSGCLGWLTSAIASCSWWRPQSYYDSAAWRGTVAGRRGDPP
jgi:predicted dehydrogenase